MRLALVLAALWAAQCTPGAPPPTPIPSPPPAPTPTVVATTPPPFPPPLDDAGPGPDCEGARMHQIALGCPPPEDAAGGWVLECSGWTRAGVITSCIKKQATCVGTRSCLGDFDQ